MFTVEYKRHGQTKSAMYTRLDLAQAVASRFARLADDKTARVINLSTGALVCAYVRAI